MTTRAGFVAIVLGLSGIAGAAPSPSPGPAPQRPPRERRLHVASAEASSYLVNDWNKFQENYLPLYVGDDDPRTAWSLKTEGIGEWLRVHVTPMKGATKLRLKIRNGYQKTPRLWAANSRAKELTVVLLPSSKTVDVMLDDKSDWQEIAVEQPAGAFEAVELRVKSVYPGKKYDDLCISDLQLYVTASSSDNPAFEKQRLDKITAWKQERVAAAKLFKTKLGQSLPIAAQYVAVPRGGDDEPGGPSCGLEDPVCSMAHALSRAARHEPKGKHADAIATAQTLIKAKFQTMTAVRVSSNDKRPLPAVDGLCTPNLNSCEEDLCGSALPLPVAGQLGYLNSEALALIEQTGLPSFDDALARKPAQCNRRERATLAWALRDAAGAPDAGVAPLRALLLVSCGLVESREGEFPVALPQLLVYGPDGHLELVGRGEDVSLLDWGKSADGPKLARANVWGLGTSGDLEVEAVTAVANK